MIDGATTVQADLGIRDGTIAAIGDGLHAPQMIDARGKLVIPGAVDPHVHLEMLTPSTISSDDWETGTIAAACGGTTTLIDFVEPQSGERLLDAYRARREP
ncbi:MAG: amidohydrolase family protein, partial [Chloroflexi bacterium]|nr:amidohydrolase family protein [Chloroflexota bacterium]